MINATLLDILDILIVAGLVYVFLLWLKQTHSSYLVSGITILSGLYFVAAALGLRLTVMIFQVFFSVFLIVLVVIFQAEIRRFFEMVGIFGIRYPWRKVKLSSDTTDILISVIDKLAHHKMGALIVLRGQEQIERHLSGGVPLMGRLSTQLLESLFDNRSPGHDGAMIIENDMLTKFAVHLPLSHDFKQLGSRGTRHAAALGLAENSDALSIIVSEESGDISVAYQGKLRKLDGIDDLRKDLRHFYQEKFPQKEWRNWKNLITRNSYEKIGAVLISFAIWYSFIR